MKWLIIGPLGVALITGNFFIFTLLVVFFIFLTYFDKSENQDTFNK